MLWKPWIDPSNFDWTDSLNPLTRPRWHEFNNPYMYNLLTVDPVWLAIRNARGMEPRIMVAPDPSAQVLAPNQTIDYVVPTEPQTWIIGFNVNSQQDQGFTFQITDAGTGATLFVQSISSALYSPANANGPIIYLATPRYIEPPSYPVVRITNNANVSNRCAVNLICVTELMQ